MQPQKNQFESAELKFSYQPLNYVVFTTEQERIVKLLQTLYCQPTANKTTFYVLFVNSNSEIFCWHSLPNIADLDACTKHIAGLAVACNAKGVLLIQYGANKTAFNKFDRLLVTICERVGVEVIDYLICHADYINSFKTSELLN